jgi:hypothetical protein
MKFGQYRLDTYQGYALSFLSLRAIMHLVNKQNENDDRKNEVYIMMNGNTNVYPLYEAMTEESK